MHNFINIVTVKIKKGSENDYIEKIKNITNFEGLISCKHLVIDSNTYCMIEEWTTKEALTKARKTIELVNEIKPLINDKSSEINITSSICGSVIIEKKVNL
mgnify:CR=1 FL=1